MCSDNLRRKPAGGYVATSTLDTAGPAPDCSRYALLSADIDGEYGYVFDAAAPRIEHRPAGDPGNPIPITPTLPGSQFPAGTRSATDSAWVYWATASGVLRARKDGSTATPQKEEEGPAALRCGAPLFLHRQRAGRRLGGCSRARSG